MMPTHRPPSPELRMQTWSARLTRFLPSLMILVTALLSACAAVRPTAEQPFADYQMAIATLSSQSEQALQQAADVELQQFKAAVLAGDKQKIANLALQFPPNAPFAWCYSGSTSASDRSALSTAAANPNPNPNPNSANSPLDSACGGDATPLFALMASMSQTLGGLNQLLLNYAGTLQALAGADTVMQFNPETAAMQFTQQSQDLLTQVAALGGPRPDISGRDLALFSTVSANLARQYLESKRKEALAGVLQSGLEPLQRLSELAQRALDITAQSVKDQYQNDVFPLLRAAVSDQDGSALDRLLSTNQQLQSQLALLEKLSQSYAALVRSQQELIGAVNESRHANLGELILYASQIRQQYENLRQQTAGPVAPKTSTTRPQGEQP